MLKEKFEKIKDNVAEKAAEEAELLKAAVKKGRHTGDGPADVAEVKEDE